MKTKTSRPRRKVTRRPRKTYRPRRRYVRRQRPGNVAEYASCSVTRSLQAATVNQMYSMMNTQLNTFARASAIAENYQHYRIKNIKLRIKSPYDTYVNTGPAGTGSYQKPYLYYMIDKSGSIPNTVTLEALKQMGARPIVMDEKPITISWRPTVLDFAATNIGGGIGLPNKYLSSPWLSTGENATGAWIPSTVDHLGVYWGVFAALQGVSNPITYDLEVEVQFEFKKPLNLGVTGAVPATPAVVAEQNSSSDGIVGGPDGQ